MPSKKNKQSQHRCFTDQARKLDRFGYEVEMQKKTRKLFILEMHYQGSSTYRTLIGFLVTVCSYTLVLINSLSIFGDFISNGNQTEISRKININVSELGELGLQDNMLGLAWVNLFDPKVARLEVSQMLVDFSNPSGYRLEEIKADQECQEFREALNKRFDQEFLNTLPNLDEMIECVADQHASMRGLDGRSEFKGIQIELIPCLAEKSSNECYPPEQLDQSLQYAYIPLGINQKQVDLSNQTQPLQDFVHIEIIQPAQEFSVELSTNTLILENNKIGFLQSEPDEQSFLAYENSQKHDMPQLNVEYLNQDTGLQEQFSYTPMVIRFYLSQVQHQHERRAYSFISLLADFGGFNDGIFLLASGFMTIYSRSMFEGSFAEQFPVRSSKKLKPNERSLNDKLAKALRRDQDVMLRASEMNKLKSFYQHAFDYIKAQYLRSLCTFCICKCMIRRKDRQMLIRKRASEIYSNYCDIRSLVNLSQNSRILINALLSKEQLAMFRRQRIRAIKMPLNSSSSSSTSSSSTLSEDSYLPPKDKEKNAASRTLQELLTEDGRQQFYQTRTQIDRRLLQGLLDKPSKHVQVQQANYSSGAKLMKSGGELLQSTSSNTRHHQSLNTSTISRVTPTLFRQNQNQNLDQLYILPTDGQSKSHQQVVAVELGADDHNNQDEISKPFNSSDIKKRNDGAYIGMTTNGNQLGVAVMNTAEYDNTASSQQLDDSMAPYHQQYAVNNAKEAILNTTSTNNLLLSNDDKNQQRSAFYELQSTTKTPAPRRKKIVKMISSSLNQNSYD